MDRIVHLWWRILQVKGRQKTHKIARNWNFIKYKSIQISTNAFLNSSDVEVDEMGWITVISHSLLYMEVTSGDNTVMHQPEPTPTAMLSHTGQEGVQVEIM